MKKTKIILMALVALLCMGATAATKKQRKGKKAAKEVAERVDTVSVDTFSYLLGMANSNGLKAYLSQRMGIDTAYVEDFLKGFQQKELTEADKREKARLAGMEIREQVETQVWSNANRQIDDSVDVLNHEQFIKGFQNGIFPVDTTFSMDSAQSLVQKQMAYYHKVKMEKKYGANRVAGEQFLKLNAKQDSVQTTASGLQYKVITMGTGEKPQKTDRVKVDYEGRLIDGTVFDSSYKRGKPATFPVGQVIAGWTEALCMMPVGSKWEVYVPQELGYGDREQQKIPPFSCLVFTVELHEIVK
ncbi:MAG: FKBP-type peptidyl-prolyl cis-trans isomerase [Bacteroidaceae bacterium]|nr:FKBP-type peptidyl-prolyl cis-trans isomerase [Bacteroidaceae bacterium]MDY5191704.1 FKBP-type peptidyl-prolyl cis-trans isomerase [Bacteroidaceae bacterium]MDY5962631.1 FKBP-type peptidyl-prolyl cis-trans isomerase [Bacteroidaceae bacterium]